MIDGEEEMKSRLLIIFVFALTPLIIPNVSAMCTGLEWWEACNDTGSATALPLNPVLIFIIFPIIVIFATIVGIILWRKIK